MHILGYVILIFGVIGIMLGLYGLLMPVARRHGLTLSLPRLRLPTPAPKDEYGSQLENVLAELESAGFRDSPFEVPQVKSPQAEVPAPAVVQVTSVASPVRAEAVAMGAAVADAEPLIVEVEAAEEESLPAELVLETEEEESVEPEAEEAAAPEAEGLDNEMMALFAEVKEKSSTPAALRDAIPAVTIEELLAEARATRQLLGRGENSSTNAA